MNPSLSVTQLLVVDLSEAKKETFITSVSVVSINKSTGHILSVKTCKISLFQIGDESSILPPKLQAEILEALTTRQKASSEEAAESNSGVSGVWLHHH